MGFYAGIDLHTRNSVVCVIDQKERKLLTETAPNDLPRREDSERSETDPTGTGLLLADLVHSLGVLHSR
jgi:hypothetical protein